MKTELLNIKAYREQKAQLKDKYNELMDQFKAANKDLIEQIDQASEKLDQEENKLRDLALQKYAETGEKKLDFGVSIRVKKILEYDQGEAFKWAKEHSLALSLDKKAFESIAKTQDLEIVKIREEPQATIPQNIEVISNEM